MPVRQVVALQPQQLQVVELVEVLVALGSPLDCPLGSGPLDFVPLGCPIRSPLVLVVVVAEVLRKDLVVASTQLVVRPMDCCRLAWEPVVASAAVAAAHPIHQHQHRCPASQVVRLALEFGPMVKWAVVAVQLQLQQRLLAVAGALELRHPID